MLLRDRDRGTAASIGPPAAAPAHGDEEEAALDVLLQDEKLNTLLNSTERLKPRKYHPVRHRAELTSLRWRENRKKITELTSITRLKSEERASSNADGQEDAAAHQADGDASADSVQSGNSAREWLAGQLHGRWGPRTSHSRLESSANAVVVNEQAAPETTESGRAERRRRWMAHGTKTLCAKLQQVHGIIPGITYGSLPRNQRRAWEVLRCDVHIAPAAPSLAEVSAPTNGGG